MMDEFDLKDLINSKKFQGPININGESSISLIKNLEDMLLIRKIEQKIALEKKNKNIGGPVHLGVGQEAVAVGVSRNLNKKDIVFGAHRSHSHLLALGSDIRKLFAELLGKKTGHSKGMGGSMHLIDKTVGFYGSVPIVSGTVSLALGAAMASRLKKTKSISVAYFGDGACEEGVVHESFNLAAINKEPILFVVENNLFASHMDIALRQPKNSTARFAKANNIPYEIVDGNDVIKVSKASEKLINSARYGNGPGFLEAITYRWYGHVDWREDIDVGIKRSKKEVDDWKCRDPIKRLIKSMIKKNYINQNKVFDIEKNLENTINSAWLEAYNDEYPPESWLLKNVYSN